MPADSPIFVVGAGRSGTTLLQLLLNAHPDIAILGEVHYFDQILRIQKFVREIDTPAHREKFVSYLRRTTHFKYLPGMEDLCYAALERLTGGACKNGSYERFYRELLRQYAHREGAKRAGEKTPLNIRYLNEIKRLFPDCRIIHIYRDPRAVVASSVRLPDNARDVMIHTVTWKYDILSAREFGVGEKCYMELAYERLVSDPVTEIRRICNFLGEEFSPEMLAFYRSSGKYIKDEPWKEATQRPIGTFAVEKWKTQLTGRRVAVIEAIAGKTMEKLGYERIHQGRLWQPRMLVALGVECGKYVLHRCTKAVQTKRLSSREILSERGPLYRQWATRTLGIGRKRCREGRRGKG